MHEKDILDKKIVNSLFILWSPYLWTNHNLVIQFDCLPFTEHDQCKLYCQADGFNFYYALSKQVKDGTKCNDYSENVCVQGKCKVSTVVWDTLRGLVC